MFPSNRPTGLTTWAQICSKLGDTVAGCTCQKAAKDLFDPKLFSPRVGRGQSPFAFPQRRRFRKEISRYGFSFTRGGSRFSLVSEPGPEAVVGILGTGQFFGEDALNCHPMGFQPTSEGRMLISPSRKARCRRRFKSEPKFSRLCMSTCWSEQPHAEGLDRQLFNQAREAPRFSADGKFVQGRHSDQPIRGPCQPEDARERMRHHTLPCQAFLNKSRKLGFIYNGKYRSS